jgi:uncharacterized membrane protein
MIVTPYHIDHNNLLDLLTVEAHHPGMLGAAALDRDVAQDSPDSEQAVPSHADASTTKRRIDSIDLLRGAVIVFMALDHVRDYFHADAFFHDPTDLTRTSAALFLTRWITHFCAPVFVFLAGLAARLHGSRKSGKELSRFLATRGAWLVFLELFAVSLCRTFDPTYRFFNLQVIWAIGVGMIVMAGLIHLDRRLLLTSAIALVAGHNLLDGVHVPGGGASSFLWAVLHETGRFQIGRTLIQVHYPLLPWIGIMALGYCCGSWYGGRWRPVTRRRNLLLAGFIATGLFVLVRAVNLYGDPAPWVPQESGLLTLLSFLNVTKYPPSVLYTLMTLGPALIALSLAERPLGRSTFWIVTFGRVPLFFYMAHVLLIHVVATVAAIATGHRVTDMILSGPVNDAPALKGYGFGLSTVYFVWLGVVAALYPCCRWFAGYKAERQASRWWLSYL